MMLYPLWLYHLACFPQPYKKVNQVANDRTQDPQRKAQDSVLLELWHIIFPRYPL